jgi:hypothetical protein
MKLRVKPKLQWRPQDVRDARNVGRLLRKAAGNEWSQPERDCGGCNGPCHSSGTA